MTICEENVHDRVPVCQGHVSAFPFTPFAIASESFASHLCLPTALTRGRFASSLCLCLCLCLSLSLSLSLSVSVCMSVCLSLADVVVSIMVRVGGVVVVGGWSAVFLRVVVV